MQKLQHTQPLEDLPTIGNQISIAIDAATEQLDFLSRISPNSSLFTSEDLNCKKRQFISLKLIALNCNGYPEILLPS